MAVMHRSCNARIRPLICSAEIRRDLIRPAEASLRRLSAVICNSAPTPDALLVAFEAVLPSFAAASTARPELDLAPWVDAVADQFAQLADATSDVRAVEARAFATSAAAPLTVPGLRRLKRERGARAVLDLFALEARLVRLTKNNIQQRLYASQEFFDEDKGARALRGDDPDRALPARIRIRAADGYLNFVLADGHHRVLARYIDGDSVLLEVSSNEDVQPKISFRRYIQLHWKELR